MDLELVNMHSSQIVGNKTRSHRGTPLMWTILVTKYNNQIVTITKPIIFSAFALFDYFY